MKEKILNFTFCLCLFTLIYIIFKNNKEVSLVILDALNLFLTRVFVSLFPMFIINDLLINENIPFYFYKLFNNLFKKIFKTSGILAFILIMSLISGTPSSAYIIKNMYLDKKITVEEANHYLMFTYFSNPLFLTLMLSLSFNTHTLLKIILIHYISNIIIGIIIRNKAPKISNNNIYIKNTSISSALIKSINKSMSTLLMILGTITFYMLIIYIINSILPLNNTLKVIISGFIEITKGLNLLNSLNISLKLKEIMAVSIISFGGLSINTQVKSILEDTNINYKYFLKGRILQTLISILLIIII